MAGENLRFQLKVTAITERGVQVLAAGSEYAFWLPRTGHVAWNPAPQVGAVCTAALPFWLAEKHARQLFPLRDVASECVRHDTRKDTNMADSRPEDAGTGALFKNDKKEKPSHPDYRGDATIKGRKFWVSGWIKTSEKSGQKFMSLAFREAHEPAKPKPAASKSSFDKPIDDQIPFRGGLRAGATP
jgi:hypothetical protein